MVDHYRQMVVPQKISSPDSWTGASHRYTDQGFRAKGLGLRA